MYRYIICCVVLIFASICSIAHAFELTLHNAPVQVYFSPDGGCTDAIIKEIHRARKEILVQAFSFTSAPIRDALLKAQKHSVKVEVILDNDEQKHQEFRTVQILKDGGVLTYIDDKHSNAHNKVMVLDRQTVITGSFNFTYAAEKRNAENIIIIKSGELAGIYAENWLNHQRHSRRY
jgi:phosphatidylserine/phosphatidylglycerophosphate/cardiolipin synthase-like enzyme